MTRTLMVTAGGTGGHIFPGLAVADHLRASGWRITWLGTKHGMESALVPKNGIEIDLLSFGGIRGKNFKHAIFGGFYLLVAFVQSARAILRRRPDVVLGTGGYPSFPGGMIAAFLGKPLVIHDSNAVAGLANRVLARVADRILCAFPRAFGDDWASRVLLTGTPVRAEIARVEAPAARFKDRRGPLNVLVVGGSLGARALNQIVPQALARIDTSKRPRVLHQSGAAHLASLREAYDQAKVQAELVPFIDDMAGAYACCDVVICRAGALTIAELTAAGVASILVPLPSALADEQTRNARYLADAGAALHVMQTELSAEYLAALLQDLKRERLLEMAQSARVLGRPDATAAVANVCAELARRRGADR